MYVFFVIYFLSFRRVVITEQLFNKYLVDRLLISIRKLMFDVYGVGVYFIGLFGIYIILSFYIWGVVG